VSSPAPGSPRPTPVLKGHAFSRAEKQPKRHRALAPEGRTSGRKSARKAGGR
jgi:hypothetical protein